jgi:hypothetical protein
MRKFCSLLDLTAPTAVSTLQRISRLGRCNQHPLSLPAPSRSLQLRSLGHRSDQHSRLARQRLRRVGWRLARRPLLRPVQQATQRCLPAGVETAFTLDPDAHCPRWIIGVWIRWC